MKAGFNRQFLERLDLSAALSGSFETAASTQAERSFDGQADIAFDFIFVRRLQGHLASGLTARRAAGGWF
nr:hypothetical protein [Brevundimonas naejangsanensis]